MIKVSAAVIEKDGKILIAKRKKGKHLENKWEFPGGKVDPGETPEECIKRELFEEFEIKSKVNNFICSSVYHYEEVSIELLVFKVSYVSGDFKLIDHEEIQWVYPFEMKKFDFAEADIPVIEIILKESLQTIV